MSRKPRCRGYRELGYGTANGLEIGPDGDKPERTSYGDVLLVERLRAAIAKLNPALDADTRNDALKQLLQAQTPSLITENRRLHRFIIEGVQVQVRRDDGTITGDQVRPDRLRQPRRNDWLGGEPIHSDSRTRRTADPTWWSSSTACRLVWSSVKKPRDENATSTGPSISCRPTGRRSRRCSAPMRCW